MSLLPKKLSFGTALKFRIHYKLKKLLKIGYKETYSQLGEDIAMNHILNHFLDIKNGFYIDVGCNHPIIFSNTFALYCSGWTGLTVDFNKELMEMHRAERKKDIQVQAAVSDNIEKVVVYEFKNHLIGTINEDFYNKMKESKESRSNTKMIETITLDKIIEENNVSKIDLLCIDVEGHDFKVLKSINLSLYRPKMIVIEMLSLDFDNLEENHIYLYLKQNGYKLIGFLIANGYFVDNS